ncbi:hypothetical protein [Tepidiforma sp.]|uniref:hypothetical protein n=1 Tax=Tepidiforma sp. TaxID=2682230 RepID=UPI002ADE6066|nr:hypothetical protein [Tepidiforma sp.]
MLAFLVGLLAGGVSVALLVTLGGNAGGDAGEAGVGNVVLRYDERALGVVAEAALGQRAVVRVEQRGRLAVALGSYGDGDGQRLVVDPDLSDGRLVVRLIEGEAGEAARLEGALVAAMDAAMSGTPYRVVAIATRDERLTLELAPGE